MSTMKTMTRLAAPFLSLLLAACAPQIAMQTVPVSTDPGEASVLVDGNPTCTSPCQVSLARNQDHILTLKKDGYRQQDVLIKRQYQTNKVLLNALNQGAQSNNFFHDGWMGANAGVMSINSQEDTGEAYVLTPSTVSLRLTPASGFPSRATAEHVRQSLAGGLSPLETLAASDQQMLENALEGTRSGQATTWNNPDTGASFSVVPDPARETATGGVARGFTLGVKQNGRTATGHYSGHRVGRGEWAVGGMDTPVADNAPLNAPNADAVSSTGGPDQGAQDITRQETMRALGETTWPSVGKTWDVGSSGSSHTSTSTTAIPGGTSTRTTTTSTKTSVSAGVHASPGAIFSVLDALMGSGN
ncbi:MAG: PEGA domain-containing protein [Humidesulfovibrio sp.]|uniref:PEGA domain-containing protein n=1 Tax=Humidesulfovibrio sp. TaxID=2910988 RepID=UPI0027F51483|nr:PEGA domain-containing protein [Humidesulfovibrio sp.]MDQ7836527.1 PEGA domain-containing protein [Humidesulfovibrio sp.]